MKPLSTVRSISLLIMVLLCPALLRAADCAGPAALESEVRAKPGAGGFVRLGQWFESHHNYECAAESYRSALKFDPSSARTIELLGNALYSLGDLKSADDFLQRSIKLSPAMASIHITRARILEQLQHTDEAKSEWQTALKLAPTSVEALDGMSRHLMVEGDYGGAIDLLRGARPTSSSEILTLDLAQVYGKSGMLEEAQAILKKMVAARSSSFPLTSALITVIVNQHYLKEASALAGKYAAAHPQNFDAQRLYLRVLITAQDNVRALPLAQRLLQSHPDDDYTLYANGWLELQAGSFSDAKRHLQKSVSLNPNFSSAHFQLGIVLAKINEPQAAKQQFEEVLALGSQQPEAHFELAKVLKTLGESQEAAHQLALFDLAKDAESQQNLRDSITAKAEQELAAGNAANAANLYREALQTNPNDALLNYKLSVALDAAGDTAGERAALEKSVQIDPDMAIAQNQLGYLDSRDGDPAAAEEHFRQAVRAAPNFADAWINLAATLGMESKLTEAEAAVTNALKLEPKNTQALQLKQELAASREQQK